MRDYVARSRERGDLLVVDKEIDPFHELAAVTDVAQKRWGKPILFTNVKGTRFPVITNVYGSRERLAEVIGIDSADFCRQWSNLANLGSASVGDPFVKVEDVNDRGIGTLYFRLKGALTHFC
jgi:UbiD family decarboxylase